MLIFAIWIENALDLAIECSQHADPRMRHGEGSDRRMLASVCHQTSRRDLVFLVGAPGDYFHFVVG
jgi:hypothetical protein